MIGGIITLIFGVLSIVMFTQPVIGIYGQSSEGDLSSIDSKASSFDFITFDNFGTCICWDNVTSHFCKFDSKGVEQSFVYRRKGVCINVFPLYACSRCNGRCLLH